jgi:hypothetical protein
LTNCADKFRENGLKEAEGGCLPSIYVYCSVIEVNVQAVVCSGGACLHPYPDRSRDAGILGRQELLAETKSKQDKKEVLFCKGASR